MRNFRKHLSATRLSGAMPRLTAILLVISAGLIPSQAWAGRHHSHPNAYNVIREVDEAGKKVLVGTEHNKDHTEKAVIVTAFTEITVDGVKATLHDLKKGMSVKVDLESDNEAAALDATHVNPK